MTDSDDILSDSDATLAPPDSALPKWLTDLPGRFGPIRSARPARSPGGDLAAGPAMLDGSGPRCVFRSDCNGSISAGPYCLQSAQPSMRGAGCTWNDIADREIDAKVARSASRPIPSGQVTLQEAYIFLGLQLFIGFLVWLCLPR